MAQIVFVTPYYPPEVGAAQVRISETATRLVARGHRVTVLTTLPNYPLGVVPPEYQRGKNRHELPASPQFTSARPCLAHPPIASCKAMRLAT